jgi:hypothetical protein
MGWNDLLNKDSKGSGSSELKYASLAQGTHQLRCLDEEPYSRYTHWVQAANSGNGMTINCIGRDCPICQQIKADKAQKKTPKYTSRKMHACNFIDRATGDVVIVDKGNRLYEALAGLMAEVGDLRDYDVKIRVTGTGTDTSYTPIPMPPAPLTAEEQALEKYDFSKLYVNLTAEQVLKLMTGASYKELLGTDESNDLEVDFTK